MTIYYFYTNQNFVRDILSSNVIACSASSRKNRVASIGCCKDTHLFITQKKLKKDIRMNGLNPEAGDFPVTIVLNIPDMKNMTVTFANIIDGKCSLSTGMLKDRLDNNYTGIFIKGLIPFSYVTGFLFESEDNIKDLRQPSPDLWYPEGMFRLLYQEDFKEDIDEDILKSVVLANEDDRISIIRDVSNYKKIQAAGYYAIKATKNWVSNGYQLNVDPYIIDLLGLNIDDVKHKLKTIISKDINDLDEINNIVNKILQPIPGDVLTSKTDDWYPYYMLILEELNKTGLYTNFDEREFSDIKNNVLSKIHIDSRDETYRKCEKYFTMITEHIYLNMGHSLENLLISFNESPVMKSNLFVLKYPHSNQNLDSTLDAYDIDKVSSRLAEMNFARINDMYGLDGSEKNNLFIIRAIDENTISNMIGCSNFSLAVYTNQEYFTILNESAKKHYNEYDIYCERIITMEEVHEYFMSECGFTNLTKDELFSILSSEKIPSKIRNQFLNSCNIELNEKYCRETDEINKIISEYGNQIPKEYGKVIFNYHKKNAMEFKKLFDGKASEIGKLSKEKDLILQDYIIPEKIFSAIYKADEEFWKKKYKDCFLNHKNE